MRMFVYLAATAALLVGAPAWADPDKDESGKGRERAERREGGHDQRERREGRHRDDDHRWDGDHRKDDHSRRDERRGRVWAPMQK
jgi:hypothetical protein